MQPIIRWNLGLTAVLAGMIALRLLLWPMAQPACADCAYRPIGCDFINRLAVDYLNNNVGLPDAFGTTSGSLVPGHIAEFRVFALADDPDRYWDVTSEAESRCRFLRLKVKAAPGSHDVSGRVVYTNYNNVNHLYYVPRHHYRKDRVAILTFEYRCSLPQAKTYTTTFTLTIPAEPSTARQAGN